MNQDECLRLAERVREACIRAARESYEDAAMAGLCEAGAWEAAISGIRRLDLHEVVASEKPDSG